MKYSGDVVELSTPCEAVDIERELIFCRRNRRLWLLELSTRSLGLGGLGGLGHCLRGNGAGDKDALRSVLL